MRKLILGCAGAIFFGTPVFAQPVAAPPLIRNQLLEPVQRNAPPPGGDADILSNTETTQQALPPNPGDAGPGFALKAIEFRGVTEDIPAAVRAVISEYDGRTITFIEVGALLRRMETAFEKSGLLIVELNVPAQDISDGVLTVEVFEGVLENIRVQGDFGKARSRVEGILSGLSRERPMRRADIERALLLSRDVPGVSLTAAMAPALSETPGRFDIVIFGSTKDVDGFVSVDNIVSEVSGFAALTGSAGVNNLTSLGDRTQVFGTISDSAGLAVAGLSHELILTNDGLKLKALGVYGRTEPGDEFGRFDIRNSTLLARGELEYPVIRSRARSLWGFGGLEFASQESRILSQRSSRDILVIGYAGLRGGMQLDRNSQVTGDVELRVGLRDESNLTPSRADGEGNSLALRASIDLESEIIENVSLAVGFRGQISPDSLLSYEEIGFGGRRFGRGYDEATLTGDSGFGSSTEIRVAPPGMRGGILQRGEFFAFYDAAAVWNENTGTDDGLDSVGMGLRFRLIEDVNVEGYIARPLKDTPTQDDDFGGFFSVTKFF